MAFTQVVKSYPLLRIALLASAILVVVAIFASKIVSDPNDADIRLFLILVGAAVLLPFLSLTWRRREVITYELPSDRLSGASRKDLEGMLAELDRAKAQGDIPQGRYEKARDRIKAAMAKR
jgi:hypothetical protein